MFTFGHATEDRQALARLIRRVLAHRNAMNAGELALRLGADRPAVRGVLDEMCAAGDIERLRPVGYAGDEHDFFRLSRPVAGPVLENAHASVRFAGRAMTCVYG